MGQGKSEFKGLVQYTSLNSQETYMYTFEAHRLPFSAEKCIHSQTFTFGCRTVSAKCQPDKSQELKVKWNINILTN